MSYFVKPLLVISLTLIALVGEGFCACECMPVASTSEAVRNSTHVFAGTILDKKRVSIPELGDDFREFHMQVRVIRYWKGDLGKQITIRTADDENNCGYDFKKGNNYVIYAIGGKTPHINVCSRTVPLKSSQGDSDLLHLGEPKYP